MAVVYRGIDEVLGRTVAIKTMLPQYATDPSFAARFTQEAQAAAALSSPYIVSVYDWGKDGDTYYIVMEYLRGTDLKSGIRRHGALDCKKVAQIGSQIAQALSVAHRHEIIHRDIKPQNIMVLRDGNVKVMDFGIARAKNSHLTTDNSVLDTAHYVSPEQTQGKELGPTTDIYSLGIVMYEAATGRVPFEGDDAISVALKQVNEQPMPPSQINPNVDPSLESIILKCMQKDPAARFQTADQLNRVLRDYIAGRLQEVQRETSVLPAVPTNITTIRANSNVSDTVTVKRPGNPRRTNGGKPTTAQELAMRQAEERERKAKRRRMATTFGFIALLAVIVGALVVFMSNSETTRSVPNLNNLTQAEALTAIDETDFFERGEVTTTYSTTVEEGRVIDQTPKPNKKAEKGTKIDIVVSLGEQPKETVIVPDLKNMTPAEAEKALSDMGLKGSNGERVYDDNVADGHVAKQSPEAGKPIKEGETVTYNLSKGKESVEVPNLAGVYYTTAESNLKALGFTVETVWDYSNDYDYGYVFEQSKTGMAEKGSSIRIVVSSGPNNVDVPDVIGYDQDSAYETLSSAGFSVNVVTQTSDEQAGIVVGQDPQGGTKVSKDGSKSVTIYVSSGPATPEPAPDDSGSSEQSVTPSEPTDTTNGQ